MRAEYRAAGSVAVLLTFLLLRSITSWRSNGDTAVLVDHSEQVLQCLRTGILRDCPVVHFPLFQFVPALVLKGWDVPDSTVFRLFAVLNWTAFAATVALMWWAVQRQASRAVALAAVFVLLTSPFLPYTVDTFNEPAAAFLTLAFSIAAITGSRWYWVMVLFVLAGLTKETASPFLCLIGLLGMFRHHDSSRRRVEYAAALLVATAISIAISSGFNYFRYGSPLNTQLLAREFRVDTFEQQAVNFAGLWLSPNGGVIPFWASLGGFCVAILITAVTTRAEWHVSPWPSRVLVLLLLGLTAGLSAWYAPHGWIAWGPRLMLPWLPAIVYLTCVFYPRVIERAVGWFGAHIWRVSIIAALFIVCALPNFVAVLDTSSLEAVFQPDTVFPMQYTIQQSRLGYFTYLNYLMWSKRSMLIDSYNVALHPSLRVHVLLYVTCMTVLAQATIASARRP